jgi:Trk K+ transport system NAD-binding subunit
MPLSRRIIRRWIVFLSLLPLFLVGIALVYMVGMTQLENEPRDFFESLAWAADTVSTTGHGPGDSLSHPLMLLFVVAVQFTGVFLVFLAFPVFVVPFFERRFEERISTVLHPKLRDFVLIYRYGPAVSSLMEDMRREGIPFAIVEEDEDEARRLRRRGHKVALSRIEEEDPLADGLDRARALVLNGPDEANASLVLGARERGFEGPIYCFVQNPLHRQPLMLAGATAAYSPKHALAAALAAQASERISPRIAGLQQLGEHLELAELRIQPSSPVADITLKEAGVRERTGASIVGLWEGGVLNTRMHPDTVLRSGAIMVALGSAESLVRLGRRATPLPRSGPFLVAGYGEVGTRVVALLRDVGEEVRVIDQQDIPGVDVVGDALDTGALRSLRVEEARAVIIALSTDSANLFATAIVRDIAPEVPIITRVNRAEEVSRVRAAGADFALSISQVAGQLLSLRLFGEEFVALEPDMRVVKTTSRGIAGHTPISARIREQTGCSVVAVERMGEILVELGRDFTFDSADTVYLCGSGEAATRYFELYPKGPPPHSHNPPHAHRSSPS